jgi:predicted metal-binding protein
MKKIAIWNCLKANDVCTGAACLHAFNKRKAAFSIYEKEELELVAFSKCNGCNIDIEKDEGMNEKLDRLIKIQTDVIHFGVCTKHDGEECPTISNIANRLKKSGMTIVRGCHS